MGVGGPNIHICGFTPLCHLGSCLAGRRCPEEDERGDRGVRDHLGLPPPWPRPSVHPRPHPHPQRLLL